MDVIPVIDVRYGHVVRAVAGDRANYRLIETPLASTAAPVDVARGLLALHPFKALYVADLDGIEGRTANTEVAESLLAALPGFALWLDNGTRSRDSLRVLARMPHVSIVIGSETGVTPQELRDMEANWGHRIILSLDFAADGAFKGDPAVLDRVEQWPSTIIAMTLGRVGGAAGPDLDRLRAIRASHSGARLYAAGGIRDRADLAAAEAAGASGALISTALHAGTITAGDLNEIAGRRVSSVTQ